MVPKEETNKQIRDELSCRRYPELRAAEGNPSPFFSFALEALARYSIKVPHPDPPRARLCHPPPSWLLRSHMLKRALSLARGRVSRAGVAPPPGLIHGWTTPQLASAVAVPHLRPTSVRADRQTGHSGDRRTGVTGYAARRISFESYIFKDGDVMDSITGARGAQLEKAIQGCYDGKVVEE